MSSGKTLPIDRSPPQWGERRPPGAGHAASSKTLRRSERFCRRLAKSHYENFLVGTILLPRPIRQPFYNIYAFCRTADDLADESASPRIALGELDRLRGRLRDTFAGHPPAEGLFPALADTAERFELSIQPFEDLLSAFRQDQTVPIYESETQLLDYCQRSANPVGRIILQLAGALDARNAERSDQICSGLQLANFWQDVARDRRMGRVYLPADQRARFGVTLEMLDGATTPDPLRALLAELCTQADGYFDRGAALVDRVPRWLSADLELFVAGGRATLQAIRAIDFDVLAKRPTVGRWQQMLLLARAWTRRR